MIVFTPAQRTALLGASAPLPQVAALVSTADPTKPRFTSTPVDTPGPGWPHGAASGTLSDLEKAENAVLISEFLVNGLNNLNLVNGLDDLENELWNGFAVKDPTGSILPVKSDYDTTYKALVATKAAGNRLLSHLLPETLLAPLKIELFNSDLVVPLSILQPWTFYEFQRLKYHLRMSSLAWNTASGHTFFSGICSAKLASRQTGQNFSISSVFRDSSRTTIRPARHLGQASGPVASTEWPRFRQRTDIAPTASKTFDARTISM